MCNFFYFGFLYTLESWGRHKYNDTNDSVNRYDKKKIKSLKKALDEKNIGFKKVFVEKYRYPYYITIRHYLLK